MHHHEDLDVFNDGFFVFLVIFAVTSWPWFGLQMHEFWRNPRPEAPPGVRFAPSVGGAPPLLPPKAPSAPMAPGTPVARGARAGAPQWTFRTLREQEMLRAAPYLKWYWWAATAAVVAGWTYFNVAYWETPAADAMDTEALRMRVVEVNISVFVALSLNKLLPAALERYRTERHWFWAFATGYLALAAAGAVAVLLVVWGAPVFAALWAPVPVGELLLLAFVHRVARLYEGILHKRERIAASRPAPPPHVTHTRLYGPPTTAVTDDDSDSDDGAQKQ